MKENQSNPNADYTNAENLSRFLLCPRCGAKVPDAPYCCHCGKMLKKKATRKRRGNGQGTVIQRGGKYRAVVTLGYWWDENGKKHRKTRSATFDRKRDAVDALATLKTEKTAPPSIITLRELYERWEPTHRVGASTMECYAAAFKHMESLWFDKVSDLTVDDLQDCLDECPRGRRTKENMRALFGLLFKYAVPRKLCEMNLAQYLTINAESSVHRTGFDADQIKKISDHVGKVPGADLILIMIYTGFRPSEFLALTGADFDRERMCLTGGAKTDAGKNRVVTISPKIAQYIPHKAADAPLCGFSGNLKQFTEQIFYPALTACGIDNPMIEINGVKRHMYTPHSCRHTFATLMKSVPGADKDKLELIGHASTEMLRYYQDVGLEDLRRITDQL